MIKAIYWLSELPDDGEFVPLLTFGDEEEKDDVVYPSVIPVLALKNTVLFPGVVIPITIGRDKSIKAVRQAYSTQKYISVHSQRDMTNEDPGFADLYSFGTVARIIKMIKMPDGSTTAILQGRIKTELKNLTRFEP